MPRPFRHPKSGVWTTRKVVPEPLRPIIGKTVLQESLGTKDEAEAKRRHPAVLARFENIIAQAKSGPVSLSERDAALLAGEWYVQELEYHSENPGDPEDWDFLGSMVSDLAMEDRTAAILDFMERHYLPAFLAERNLTLTPESRKLLGLAMFRSIGRLFNILRKRSKGDYSPDPHLSTFPKPSPKQVTTKELVAKWAEAVNPAEKSVDKFRLALRQLIIHAGVKSPAEITKQHVRDWVAALYKKGLAPKTVSNKLTMVKTLLRYGRDEDLLKEYVLEGFRDRHRTRAVTVERRGYTDSEAVQILTDARQLDSSMRWVTWLMAFTGARVNEIAQLWMEDVQEEEGVWFIDINERNEGKRLKNQGSVRRVPLHPVLLQEGFLDYVRSVPSDSPLFPDLTTTARQSAGDVVNRKIRRRVRESLKLTDPGLAPSHSWRHRFKRVCRDSGIPEEIHDYLTGHAPANTGRRYGKGSGMDALYEQMKKISVPEGL